MTLTIPSSCRRCNKAFSSWEALTQHANSGAHTWPCSKCNLATRTWDALLQHYRDKGCMKVCEGCDNGTGVGWNNDLVDYKKHLERVCAVCGLHCNSDVHLKSVSPFLWLFGPGKCALTLAAQIDSSYEER